jgi:DNA-binding MarR family transcriptional regulator
MLMLETAVAGSLSELYRRPGFLIRRAHQIAVSIFTEECRDFDITATQYGVLFALGQCAGVDQITLARLLGLDRSTIGLVVSLLETRQLLTRTLHAQDRRKRVLALSERGTELLVAVRPAAAQAVRDLLAPFSEMEGKVFVTLLERLVAQAPPGPAAAELAELYSRPGFLIRRAHQIAVAVFTDECAAFDITTTQFGVAVALTHNPGIDQNTLARLLGLDRSTTGLVVSLLESRGLLDRTQHGTDRRKRMLVLSEPGVAWLQALMPIARNTVNTLLAAFTELERCMLVALLERLVEYHNTSVRVPLFRAFAD